MTEPDKVSGRYRELAREEPSAALDARILAAARESTRPVVRRRQQWMVPVSIAAVLVLGIGVSLRMQLEQPGIETSVPSTAPSESRVAIAPPEAPKALPEAAPPASQAPARADANAPRAS